MSTLTSEASNDPAGFADLEPWESILVYLVNGNPITGVDPVRRRVVRYKGKLCVRDHGRIPLRRCVGENTYAT